MDFKSYVKTLLKETDDENKKTKKAEEDIEDDDDDEESDEEDDEVEASCKTHKNGCTGSESCASVEDDEDDEEEDEEDEEEEEKKGNSLKESILYSSSYLRSSKPTILSEEVVQVLCESIKNNSASKFMTKLAKKAAKEAAKWARKGDKEKARVSKQASRKLEEASNRLFKAESDYKSGAPEAKKEYKDLCKKYSKELKGMGKGAKVAGTVAALVAGSALLGAVGLTAMANDDVIDRLEDGLRKGKLGETIKGMAIKDKEALANIIDSFKEEGLEAASDKAKSIEKDAWKNDGWKDDSFKENKKHANEQFMKGAKELKDDAVEKIKETGKKAADTITRKENLEKAKGAKKVANYLTGNSSGPASSGGYGRR